MYGCFTHLRIVHPTDRPAWMVHCSVCLLYGLPTVTNRRQLASTTRRFDHWQTSDWKGLPDATQIDKQTVLFAKHDSENYLGLAILLPDWQRRGQLWQLTRALGRLGFDTLLLLPSPQQTELDPAAEKKVLKKN